MPVMLCTRMPAAYKSQCSAIMVRNAIRLFLAATAVVLVFAAQLSASGQTAPSRPALPVRLYVIDCGTLHIADMGRFQLKKDEVATTDLSVACFLVVHPKGTLIWDTGAVPDASWKPTGSSVTQHIVLPDAQQRDVTMVKSLRAQLAELGYSPSDYHLPRSFALPLRPHGQRERVCRCHVARPASRTRRHVR